MEYNLVFQPSGRRGVVPEGTNLHEAYLKLGDQLVSPCGGSGTCGKCKVKIEEGFFADLGINSSPRNLSPLTEQERTLLKPEEIADNVRLACCALVYGDIRVFVPEPSRESTQIILETGQQREFSLNPAVKKYYVEIAKPTLEDCRDDLQRTIEALKSNYTCFISGLDIDYFVLKDLPDVLRKGNWKVTLTVWNNREIIDVEPGRVNACYGVAIDLGTTTIVASLCDLTTGKVLKRDSMVNSQVRYGDDVISRITYCMMNDDGLEKLNKLVIADINCLIKNLTEAVDVQEENVSEVLMVCNTAMHHIALNIAPQYLGQAPFPAAMRKGVNLKARNLGIIISRSGNIHCLPIEAGFVGADNVAVLISEEPYKQEKMMLLIDIGTNGEIDLGNKKGMTSTSCATGPALEGAQIKFGMRAAPGAIEKVSIDHLTLEPQLKIISQSEDSNSTGMPTSARGVCGSGLIDVIAEMFKTGIILPDGRFNKGLESERVRKNSEGKMEYVLVWADQTSIAQDICITQKDVRAVQLAKAALYAGSKMLMNRMGVKQVEKVVLAGAFGSYINKESAMLIGMFPNCALEDVSSVGNAAGEGARLALLDMNKRMEAEEVVQFIKFCEIATENDFQTQFYNAMSFPHATDSFPHIQPILDQIPSLSKMKAG